MNLGSMIGLPAQPRVRPPTSLYVPVVPFGPSRAGFPAGIELGAFRRTGRETSQNHVIVLRTLTMA